MLVALALSLALTAPGAEHAVERKADRVYHLDVDADCRRTAPRRFRCSYLAPGKAGTGRVRQLETGRLRVRLSRPHTAYDDAG